MLTLAVFYSFSLKRVHFVVRNVALGRRECYYFPFLSSLLYENSIWPSRLPSLSVLCRT